MKPTSLTEAIEQIATGASRAADQETERLDFKRDPATIATPKPGNPQARLVQELIDAVVCFANAQGGQIVVGVDDKLSGPEAFVGTAADINFVRQKIFNNTIPHLTLTVTEHHVHDARLLIIDVPEGLDLVTDAKGKALQRTGTTCQPISESGRRALSFERRNPDLSARRSELDVSQIEPSAVEQVRSLLRQLVDLRTEMADLPTSDLLRALSLVDGDERLLIAGEILLCRPRQDTVDIHTRAAPGAEPSTRRLREPLVAALITTLSVVRTALQPEVGHVSLPTGQEFALPDFSPIAVDEAVTNAFVHRDWGTEERVIVDHSPEILRVWSPGALPYGVTVDRLLSTVSTPRNHRLMGALQILGLAERASRGFDRMFKEQIRVGQAVPGLRVDDYSVEVYFTSRAPNRSFAAFVASLPDRSRNDLDVLLVLDWLCKHATLSAVDAGTLLQASIEEATQKVDRLAVGPDAVVERDGDRRRGTRWRLSSLTAAGLGTAVTHRTRADAARPRVISHLRQYGWITNKTVRNMFDLDVQQATQILADLRGANVIVKDPDGPKRGPAIRWLPLGEARPTGRTK